MHSIAARIGSKSYGNGPIKVLVLHDWFCDPTSWEGVLPYLSLERFTYLFPNFRGYGSSREIPGDYTLDEATDDMIALVDRLSWSSFAVVGHSMGALVDQRMMQKARERVSRVVAVTPVPPTGLELDEESAQHLRGMAMTDDDGRREGLSSLWGDRLGQGWLEHKIRRWRKTADPRAVAAYVSMYGETDVSAEPAQLTEP
jgi:pimeloyl-ACP methyl ester carboxylesterase